MPSASAVSPNRPSRPRRAQRRRSVGANDPLLYDELAEEWWRPRGAFAPLHWLAAARGALVVPASGDSSVLVDLACGGGLLAPHVRASGHRHVGLDIGPRAASIARDHGVVAMVGDVAVLPLRTSSVDVVVAGEILEHVVDLAAVVAEIGRVLRPGGQLVVDTLAPTRRCRFALVTVGERVGMVPRGTHDARLFVGPGRLVALCDAAGIDLSARGVRPAVLELVAWLARRREHVTMRASRSTAMVYQGIGVKRP